jgi:hypothetical protein
MKAARAGSGAGLISGRKITSAGRCFASEGHINVAPHAGADEADAVGMGPDFLGVARSDATGVKGREHVV